MSMAADTRPGWLDWLGIIVEAACGLLGFQQLLAGQPTMGCILFMLATIQGGVRRLENRR